MCRNGSVQNIFGPPRESNSGPRPPERRIIPLDQGAVRLSAVYIFSAHYTPDLKPSPPHHKCTSEILHIPYYSFYLTIPNHFPRSHSGIFIPRYTPVRIPSHLTSLDNSVWKYVNTRPSTPYSHRIYTMEPINTLLRNTISHINSFPHITNNRTIFILFQPIKYILDPHFLFPIRQANHISHYIYLTSADV